MKDNERFKKLIDEIRSFPEPNYEKDFNKEKQEKIHTNLMKIAIKHERKKQKRVIVKKIMVGFGGLAAILLATVMYLSMDEINRNTSDTGRQIKEENQEVIKDSEEEGVQPEEETTISFDESHYKKIEEIYDNYELVTEGEGVDYIDNEYGVIYYIDGISIVQESKSIAHWPLDDNLKPITPESYQTLGAIKGSIEELGSKSLSTVGTHEVDYEADIEHKLEVLNRIKDYAGNSYEPLVDWLNSTISYFEEANSLLDNQPEVAQALHREGMNNIRKFMESLGSGIA